MFSVHVARAAFFRAADLMAKFKRKGYLVKYERDDFTEVLAYLGGYFEQATKESLIAPAITLPDKS